MIAETISSACFVLLVVVFCYMIKIYTVVKNIRPSRNERARGVYVRDNQRGLPVQRDLTVYFPQAERDTRQRGTCNNSTYSRLQARQRQPQIHDERFGWQSNTNFPMFQSFAFTAFKHSSCISSFVSFLTWYDIVLTIFTEVSVANSSHAIEKYWNRNEFPSQFLYDELTTSRGNKCQCMDRRLLIWMH